MNILRMALILAGIMLACAAQAADIGECATPEQMTAKLKGEDQRSIASAQRITADKKMVGMIFTMNPNRSVGYILQADQPMGDRASKICVWTRLANIRLFDARKPGLPAEALLKAPEADALRRCDELAKGGKVSRESCGSFNTMKQKAEAHGERVMIQGFTVEKQADGTYKPNGTLATLSGRLGGSIDDFPDHPGWGIGGVLTYSSLPDGASIINAVVVYPEYTPYGLSLLAER
jgi:hypothetical protein